MAKLGGEWADGGGGEEDVEEEEEEGTERIVGEKGWEVLEWLVAVWEADQAGFEKDNTGRSESLQTKSGLLLLSQRPAACNELI